MRRKIVSLCLTLALAVSLLGGLTAANAVSYATNYQNYDQPESDDYVYWNGYRPVQGPNTTNSEVYAIQCMLNAVIKKLGLNVPYAAVDGGYGQGTATTCRGVQAALGLTADGKFGAQTLAKMKEVLENTAARPRLYAKAHIENLGTVEYSEPSNIIGTIGQGKRVEALWLWSDDSNVRIGYSLHLSKVGWVDYGWNGAMVGSTGLGRQAEAVRIVAEGLPQGYRLWYRAHCQNIGWETTWKTNGQTAGTEGKGLRMEAIQVAILRDGEAFPAAPTQSSSNIKGKYNISNALTYAKAHWNDGKGLCAEFVSDCIRAGGLSSYSGWCPTLYALLKKEVVDGAKTASVQYLKTSGNYIRVSDNVGKIAVGDILFWTCRGPNCSYKHVALVSDVSGTYVKVYQHNSAQNNTAAWIGNCYSCGRHYENSDMVVIHFK